MINGLIDKQWDITLIWEDNRVVLFSSKNGSLIVEKSKKGKKGHFLLVNLYSK